MELGPVSRLEKEDDGPRKLRQNGQHGHHVRLQMINMRLIVCKEGPLSHPPGPGTCVAVGVAGVGADVIAAQLHRDQLPPAGVAPDTKEN